MKRILASICIAILLMVLGCGLVGCKKAPYHVEMVIINPETGAEVTQK